MKKKIKILFTGLTHLNHNYGAQGIALPLMEKLNEFFEAEYTFILSERYYKENLLFSKKYNFNIITNPKPLVALGECYFFIYILYNFARLLKKKEVTTKKEKEQHLALVERLKENDVVIDLSGIEFIGDVSFKRKYLNYINTIYMQCLADKYNKPYLKYTKSYGPFSGKIYSFFVRKQLNKLPFIFVRGENNLKEIKKLNLRVPTYSFPDISISMKAESKDWAVNYIAKLGLNLSKPIVGISPSSVIAGMEFNSDKSSCGSNHIRLCKEIVNFYQLKGLQILLIPHSLGDGINIRSCDLALSKKIYTELRDKTNIFMISDRGLTYKQVRAIIGLLDFYITGRYHSISSALSMGIPVISLSWHIKYKDIMALFLDNFLTIDCRTTSVREAFSLAKKYYNNRQWFNRDEVLGRKKEVIKQINKSVDILANEIKKYILYI